MFKVKCEKCDWKGSYTTSHRANLAIVTHNRFKHAPKKRKPREWWMRTWQAAEMLGVSRELIIQLIRQGRLPHRKVKNRYEIAYTTVYQAGLVREVLATFPNPGRGRGWRKAKPRLKPRDMSEVKLPRGWK